MSGALSNGKAVTSGAIGGVFVGASSKPDFIGGFMLQSGADAVQGLTQLKQ